MTKKEISTLVEKTQKAHMEELEARLAEWALPIDVDPLTESRARRKCVRRYTEWRTLANLCKTFGVSVPESEEECRLQASIDCKY